MFSELKALVAFAEAGSMDRAARDLQLTPSALSRRIQRLEAELGAVLVDRHHKPPKLTSSGVEVLDQSRGILSSVGQLKATVSGTVSPEGAFRFGMSHALAQPEISNVIVEIGKRFPCIQPTIINDTSPQLITRLDRGDLDGALVV